MLISPRLSAQIKDSPSSSAAAAFLTRRAAAEAPAAADGGAISGDGVSASPMNGACVRVAPLGRDAHSDYGSIGVGVRVIVSDGMGVGDRIHSPEEDVGGLTRRGGPLV